MLFLLNSSEKEAVEFRSKIKTNDEYAVAVCETLVNTFWSKKDAKSSVDAYTFREVSHFVAEIRDLGESYLDWYFPCCLSSPNNEVVEDMEKAGYKMLSTLPKKNEDEEEDKEDDDNDRPKKRCRFESCPDSPAYSPTSPAYEGPIPDYLSYSPLSQDLDSE
jgi:hypothetical protein